MKTSELKQSRLEYIIILDMMFIGVLYLVPTLSHLTSIPFYRFEPMRCALLLNLLFSGNKNNAYIMAVTLPLFSFFIGGHPVFAKALLMAAELSANVFLFDVLSRRIKNKAVAMVLSILASKVFYYIIKFGIISVGILKGPMVATGLMTQLIVAVVLSVAFWKFSEKAVYKS